MIANASWKYVLIRPGDPESGYRVKRRAPGSALIELPGGSVMPMTASWTSPPAPNSIHYVLDNRDYVQAFWSVVATEASTSLKLARVDPPGPVVTESSSGPNGGGSWSVSATAYYVWKFPPGPGNNAMLIDAFDIDAADFMADDFVDVTPDPNGTLTPHANNGYIDTDAEIAMTDETTGLPNITVRARDAFSVYKFSHWQTVDAVQFSAHPKYPVTVGQPDIHDIVARRSDIVVAFACYNEIPRSPIVVHEPNVYDPLWWLKTHWGLLPWPGPFDPRAREVIAALELLTTSSRVAPQLRASILELAAKQLTIVASEIKKDLDRGE